MILLGLGANLPSDRYGPPLSTLSAALDALSVDRVALVRRSHWYRSAPLPKLDQPSYVNGVAAVSTRLEPQELLLLLHHVEQRFGRVRRTLNEPRPLDLDLLDYQGLVVEQDCGLTLPHPRLHERAFVLEPLREIVPRWRHPVSGTSVDDLIARLPPGQHVERLDE
jgi:2-amino-4-hydroxy-6-hydroxymethyldihydropteridine diphosphokinase